MRNSKVGIRSTVSEYGIVLVLVAVLIFFSIMSNKFFTVSNLITIARQVAMVGIASCGMLIILILGQIDLSIGSMASLVGVLAAFLMKRSIAPGIACLIVFIAMGLVGLLQGFLVAKIKVPAFIVTMSFMNILSGAAYLLIQGKPIYDFSDNFSWLGQGYVSIIPIPVIVMVVCLLISWFLLKKAYFGRYFYALGGNEEAALLAGINVPMVKMIAFIISALFTTLAGLVLLSRIQTGNAGNGTGFEFDVITACVLGGVSPSGGKGQVFNIIVGTLIIGVLNNGMIILGMSVYLQLVIKGAILVTAVSFDAMQKNREKTASDSKYRKELKEGKALAEQ